MMLEDLDLVMLMYNLIESSSNYSETTGSLWFLSNHEATNLKTIIANDIANDDVFKFFKYKAKLLGNSHVDGAKRLSIGFQRLLECI